MAEPGVPMQTELVDVPLVPIGGKQVMVHPRAIQNLKLLPLADMISRQAIQNLECETNQVGSAVTPFDSQNTQVFKEAIIRLWKRIVKWNTGGAPVPFEWTHKIRFIHELEIQTMPNTPLRQLNYQLFSLFNEMLAVQGASLQAFVDAAGLDRISRAIDEVGEFIDEEIGTGAPSGNDDGKFETGAGMPTTASIGILMPTPLQGESVVAEPSSTPPPKIPPDSPDN
jgi:hypothetical protein